MNTAKIALAATLAALMSACSSQPGDAELQEALARQFETVGGPKMAEGMKEQIKATRVLGCARAGESKAYQCDVIGLFGVAQTMRLLKSDAGWVVVQ